MIILYNIGIWLYTLAIHIASPFNEKARLWAKGRRGWRDDIAGKFSDTDRVFWFHCASLGEFEQGRPVIEKIKEREPSVKILITFYSPSGYEIRKNYDKADHIMYLPADTLRNARYFIRSVSPERAFFIKYEFWYNYLFELQRTGIPYYLVSGIFRPAQPFFRWWGKGFMKAIKGFETIFVQGEESQQLLSRHGMERVYVSGDTRFDRVYDISRNAIELEVLKRFCGNEDVIVAGSTWPVEEEIICSYINENINHHRWVIAPHEVDDSHVTAIEERLQVSSARYSRAEEINLEGIRVLIIDNIGILSSVYRYGSVAVIGGGFGKGIHNILEPASWGLPVLFGPNHSKFMEAGSMIKAGGAFTFRDLAGFIEILDNKLSDKEHLKKASKAASEYILSNLGATKIVVDNLL